MNSLVCWKEAGRCLPAPLLRPFHTFRKHSPGAPDLLTVLPVMNWELIPKDSSHHHHHPVRSSGTLVRACSAQVVQPQFQQSLLEMTAASHRSDSLTAPPPLKHIHSTCFGPLWEKLLGTLVKDQAAAIPTNLTKPDVSAAPTNPKRQKPAGSTLAQAGASQSGASTDWQRPGRTRDRRRPLASPGDLQGHLPKATQRAAAEAAEQSRTSQPSVGAATARGLPTAPPARHRGGEGAPGRPELRRRKGPWERAVAAPPGRGRAGAGPTFRLGACTALLRPGSLSSQ